MSASRGGFLKKSERSILNGEIADLRSRLDAATQRASDRASVQRAAQAFIKGTYSALMHDRLAGKRVAIVFVGSVDPRLRASIDRTLVDAGAPGPLRVRALKVPVDVRSLDTALAKRPSLASYVGDERLDELGRQLAREFVLGEKTVLWQTLSAWLVEERSGTVKRPADGVVVVRSVPTQRGATARFLAGFYRGLASFDVPAVGVELTGAPDSAVEAFRKARLATVDDLDTQPGRFALALLLGGAARGAYGTKQTAGDGLLPPVPPAPAPAESGA